MKKNVSELTALEVKIMRVLWEHEENLTIQEITNHLKNDKLSVQSITQAMKRLVKKNAVIVSDSVLVNNVYARAFTPTFTQDEFLTAEFERLHKNVLGRGRLSLIGIAASLVRNSDDEKIKENEIEELQKLIEDKKKKINNRSK